MGSSSVYVVAHPDHSSALTIHSAMRGFGLPDEAYHVTIFYLGRRRDCKTTETDALYDIVSNITTYMPPVTAVVTEAATFENGPSRPFHLRLGDAQGLNAIHDILELFMDVRAPDWRQKAERFHGFTPHITLKYLAPDEPEPDVSALIGLPVTFSSLTFMAEPDSWTFPLKG